MNQYCDLSGREGPFIPGLATREIVGSEHAKFIRDKWFEESTKLTSKQLIDAFTEKLTLYSMRGEARRKRTGRYPMSAKDRAIKTIDSFLTHRVLPTANAFEVVERAISGEPQRGPFRSPVNDPIPETLSAEDVIINKILKIITANGFDAELKLELIRKVV